MKGGTKMGAYLIVFTGLGLVTTWIIKRRNDDV